MMSYIGQYAEKVILKNKKNLQEESKKTVTATRESPDHVDILNMGTKTITETRENFDKDLVDLKTMTRVRETPDQ